MELLEQLQQDRENLAQGLERMQGQHAQLTARMNQQSGAYQYVEMLIERVQGEQNGAAVASVEAESDTVPVE